MAYIEEAKVQGIEVEKGTKGEEQIWKFSECLPLYQGSRPPWRQVGLQYNVCKGCHDKSDESSTPDGPRETNLRDEILQSGREDNGSNTSSHSGYC